MNIKDLKFVDYNQGFVSTVSFTNNVGLITYYIPTKPTYGYVVFIYYKGFPLRIKNRLSNKLTFVNTDTLNQILNHAENDSIQDFNNYINEISTRFKRNRLQQLS